MQNRNVLISGAGIAGPALAYWLLRRGFRPTLVERAPAPRGGGYMIDVWGTGWEAVKRMGLAERVRRDGYLMEGLSVVNRKGRQVAHLDSLRYAEAMNRGEADGYFVSLLRGDLAQAIYALVDGQVEAIFDDAIASIEQDADGVDVVFEHASPRRFDLVIGADGLHSRVRELAFGEESAFVHPLGYGTASFTIADYPHRHETRYVSYNVPGRQVTRYALRGNRSAFLFVFVDRDGRLAAPAARHDARGTLDKLYRDAGWECTDILDAMRHCDDLYFDAVCQTRMASWHDGRVALLGDACFCPSLLAGEGSAFAMLGAYVLAGELQLADGDPGVAFARYQQRLAAFMQRKQRSAKRYGQWFAPATRPGVSMRNLVTTLANTPPLTSWIMHSLIRDQFDFPDYPDTA